MDPFLDPFFGPFFSRPENLHPIWIAKNQKLKIRGLKRGPILGPKKCQNDTFFPEVLHKILKYLLEFFTFQKNFSKKCVQKFHKTCQKLKF